MTKHEFAQAVDSEGLGYAILHYYGRYISERIPEDESGFAELWAEAYDLLSTIEVILEQWMDGE